MEYFARMILVATSVIGNINITVCVRETVILKHYTEY